MKKKVFSFSKLEKGLLVFFLGLFLSSSAILLWFFYVENTELQPAPGGGFVEGMVGRASIPYNFNPLFSEGIEADVANLVFNGLMRFNSKTGEIEDSLATHTLSPDKRIYEFTLKDNVLWHDGQKVTANDIIFTFRDVIQNEDFSGEFLKKTFKNVQIERVDERTVRFITPEKRKTFFTNFTIGLLPRHQLAGVPVEELFQASFNQNPIGCGPYRFESFFQEANFSTIHLSSFPEYFDGTPKIESIDFRIFPSMEELIAHSSEIDAVRPRQLHEMKIFPKNPDFKQEEFISPRYLAVFFNLKDETLVTRKIRQAMRAVIDTTTLAEEFGGKRVDTPLVELWPQDDIVNISQQRAEELLRKSGYFFPEEIPLPQKDENREKNRFVYAPSEEQVSILSEKEIYVMGHLPEHTSSVSVNGFELQLFSPENKRFSYSASTKIGTMKTGENTYHVEFFDASGNILDEETVTVILVQKEDILEKEKEKDENGSKLKEGHENTQEKVRYRKNKDGEHIRLDFIHLDTFEYLKNISERMQKDWEKIGIEVTVHSLPPNELRERMLNREYDLLLLPQHIGYNLDPYPYFHLSQSGKNGFNLSNWKNLKASLLLEEIRSTHAPEERFDSLSQLRDIIINDVPALFLFTPKYSWVYDSKVKNVNIHHIALLSDRYSRVHEFYIREEREFAETKRISDFLPWLMNQTKHAFSFSQSE
jgi:ABC-type transport system substrate-binding protein